MQTFPKEVRLVSPPVEKRKVTPPRYVSPNNVIVQNKALENN